MSCTDIPGFYAQLQHQVTVARTGKIPIAIQGANSKQFYGRECHGDIVDMRPCQGIIHYDPTELVVTAYAGTTIGELETNLASQRQMLPFEPPCFGQETTLGGAVAAGLSGPRRPYTGSVRDFILGMKCLTGRGEILKFGGEVMKNVAGYDVSRLMTGAMGTLGILLEISLKVLPMPESELALSKTILPTEFIRFMNIWAGKSLPISGAAYDGQEIHIRLSGKRVAVEKTRAILDMKEDPAGLEYWRQLRDHQLNFFNLSQGQNLWRLSVPPTSPPLVVNGEWLIDWGGAQRWLKTAEPATKIRQQSEAVSGNATLFRTTGGRDEVFHPLPATIKRLHLQLKDAFDPDHILNRGRMYTDF